MKLEVPRAVVLDANTLVSAYLFPESNPGKVLDYVIDQCRLRMSMEVADELADVLRRPKFDRYLSRERREELLAGTIRDSYFVEPVLRITDCRDPKDNKYLELAADGGAVAIVTGDADLLALHPFRGVLILTPHGFLSRFANA